MVTPIFWIGMLCFVTGVVTRILIATRLFFRNQIADSLHSESHVSDYSTDLLRKTGLYFSKLLIATGVLFWIVLYIYPEY